MSPPKRSSSVDSTQQSHLADDETSHRRHEAYLDQEEESADQFRSLTNISSSGRLAVDRKYSLPANINEGFVAQSAEEMGSVDERGILGIQAAINSHNAR